MLMGATGVGALLGALSLATRVGVKGLGKLIAICAGGFGASLILFSFSKMFLAVDDSAAARGVHHDGADGVVEHSAAIDGRQTRCAAE